MNGIPVEFSRKQRRRQKQRIHAESAQVLILRGMAKEMAPTQAVVFMSYFNQFPELAVAGNDNYFFPAWGATCAQLGIKRRVFWEMTENLVRLGFLEEGWPGVLGISWLGRLFLKHEYRIAFDMLKKYTEPVKGTT
jgi:hypothetical protein